MAVIDVTVENFESEVLNSDKKVLVDFWAAWCGPCKMLSPVVDNLVQDNTDIKVAKVNVDEQGELAAKYQIMSIPTLLVFERGEIVNKSVGLLSKGELEELVR